DPRVIFTQLPTACRGTEQIQNQPWALDYLPTPSSFLSKHGQSLSTSLSSPSEHEHFHSTPSIILCLAFTDDIQKVTSICRRHDAKFKLKIMWLYVKGKCQSSRPVGWCSTNKT